MFTCMDRWSVSAGGRDKRARQSVWALILLLIWRLKQPPPRRRQRWQQIQKAHSLYQCINAIHECLNWYIYKYKYICINNTHSCVYTFLNLLSHSQFLLHALLHLLFTCSLPLALHLYLKLCFFFVNRTHTHCTLNKILKLNSNFTPTPTNSIIKIIEMI